VWGTNRKIPTPGCRINPGFRVCGQSLTEFSRTIICLTSRGEPPHTNFISRRTPTYERNKRRRQSLAHRNYSSIAKSWTKLPAIVRGIFEFFLIYLCHDLSRRPKCCATGHFLVESDREHKRSDRCMVKDKGFQTLITYQGTWISLKSVWIKTVKNIIVLSFGPEIKLLVDNLSTFRY